MTKTPEQLAEEYINHVLESQCDCSYRIAFLVGYQAAKDQLTDADKVMNSSNNSNGWISVKERLPKDEQVVLTSCEQGKMFLLRKVSEEFLGGTLLWKYCCGYDKDLAEGESYCYEISHWMPLPAAPKDEV